MSSNPARYRFVDWIGDRILQARELNTYEDIVCGLYGTSHTAYDLNAVYTSGATLNITPVVTSGTTTVTLTPTDGTNPMLVFVRGRWEALGVGEYAPITLTTGQTNIYLNWQLIIRTSVDDPALVDSLTSEPTAEMGEMSLSVSATDTSAVALGSTQFEKNTIPLVLFTFTHSGSSLVLASSTSVMAQALASNQKGGAVYLTTGTSAGVAAATDDSRLSDQRTPLDNSVTDAKVTTPVPVSGAYSSVATGISDAKVVHLTTQQLVSVALDATISTANAAEASIAGHINQPLGTGVHPMPTAAQVGAAPLSHITLPLGVTGSHPPSVNADSGGFAVQRDPGAAAAAMDPAFAVLMAGVLQSGLLHNGDVFSLLANAQTASPLLETGDPTLTSGAMGLLSTIASIVAQHVNKTSHKNPHGLTAADLGFTFGSNANGYWTKDPSGCIRQWAGNVAPTTQGNWTITYPIPFTQAGSISCVAVASWQAGHNTVEFVQDYAATKSLTGIVFLTGSSDFAPSIDWSATGY